MPHSELVQSLLRAMELLKLIARCREGCSLSELSAQCNLQKSTAHNLLRTLCAGGFLYKDQKKRFHLGAEVLNLTSPLDHDVLSSSTPEALVELQKIFPEDIITVSALESGVARVKYRISPEQPGEVQKPEDWHFPPYLSVSALALQAANPEQAELIEQLYKFEEYGEIFWRDRSAFEQKLAETARFKYCWRQNGSNWTAAFIIPQSLVMGFKINGALSEVSASQAVKQRKKAVEEFCKKVWQN